MIRYNLYNKTFFLIKIILFYLILSTKCYSDKEFPNNNWVVLGPDEATVKIKVFSSLTCPHCANFHINVVTKIKKKYIDTGKVQLIFIDFPLDQVAFNASKILHCVDKKKQIEFLDIIYETQATWTNESNINDINKMSIIIDNFSKELKSGTIL